MSDAAFERFARVVFAWVLLEVVLAASSCHTADYAWGGASFRRAHVPIGVTWARDDADLRAPLAVAMKYWNAVAGCEILKPAQSFDARVYVVSAGDDDRQRPGVLGTTECSKRADHCVVTLRPLVRALGKRILTWVLIHELGHALDLDHEDDADSVMNAVTPGWELLEDPTDGFSRVPPGPATMVRQRYCGR